MTSKHSSASQLLSTSLFDGLNSFADIEARISALPGNKERGDVFEIFAEAYLATQKIAQAKEVWPFEAIPLEQRKTLSLDTGRDMGVDGTYLTTDGELRAYQVKFRSNRPSLTWDELSTFMGLTDQVSQRVLFTNCEALPSLMQDRSGFVAIRGSDLDRLEAEDFEAMRQWLRSGQVKLPRKQPLLHQQGALTAIARGLVEYDRATVVMACGTGKSLVALWAAEQYGGKTLLVLVPSLALVRQLLHEWLRETAWERFTFMCVCSDPTVAKGADDLVVHQADLDFPVTTDSATVSRFLGKPFDGIKIVFSTYQSAQVVAEGLPVGADGVKQPFDLAIFDEAHKTASREGTRFSFALEDANLPIRKRLFFTATPRHYDIRKKDKEGDNTLVYSMDRPEVYGPVIHTLSFAEAARQDIICDYKVVISVVTSEMVNDHVLKHGEVIVEGDTVKARQVALQIALQKAIEKYGVSRIFTFHGSVAAARSFTSDDGEGIRHHLPDFTTLHVSGEMPTARREDQMKAFRQAEKAVISNARCLTEGVDVPAVDMIAFISPRKSKVDIVQATGRAMRKSPGKEFGYVMVPLFLDVVAEETIEQAIHRTDFSDVWDVLAAMREQDDVLTDIIRTMVEEKARIGGYDESRFNERVEMMGQSLSLELIRNSITSECLDNLSDKWDIWLGRLKSFRDRFGHCNVNVHSGEDSALGAWVSRQRTQKNKNLLSETQIRRLDAIGFTWDFQQQESDKTWMNWYQELVKYSQENGNPHVPRTHLNTKLASWVWIQRQRRRGTSAVAAPLSEEQIALLDNLGFYWDARDGKWTEMFYMLQKFKEKHGHCRVELEPIADTDLLGWIVFQRSARSSGKLSEDRVMLLDGIGFHWQNKAINDQKWNESYERLKQYHSKYGDTNVPHRWKDDAKLAAWVSFQRQQYKEDNLLNEQVEMLNQIGFTWVLRERGSWDDRFEELVNFQKLHGHFNVPSQYPAAPKLKQFLISTRFQQRQEKLSKDRVIKLDSIGFPWEEVVSKAKASAISLTLESARQNTNQGSFALEAGISLQGKLVVVTGKLSKFSRSRAVELIEAAGGMVGEHLTRKTDYLVAGADAGSKLRSAQNLGVTIISEDELMSLLDVSHTPNSAQ